MKKFLNIEGVSKLSKTEQKSVAGGIGNPDLSLCGCDCAGNVTGPFYCSFYFGCPQVYTCGQDS